MSVLTIRTTRFAALVWCAAVVVSACGSPGPVVKASASSAAPALNADSLIISLPDLRRITNTDDLEEGSKLDASDGGPIPHYNTVPPECEVEGRPSVAFGQGWRQFRGLPYITANAPYYYATQAVGVYPDEGAARKVFDKLVSQLAACSALHSEYFPFTMQRQDPSTVTLCWDRCSEFYRVRSSVVIEVSADGFPESEQIARTILQIISDRINAT